MKFKLIILIVLGLALSSMVKPNFVGNEPEMRVDSIVKSDSVKYIVFTSSEDHHEDSVVRRMWSDKNLRYSYYFKYVDNTILTFDASPNSSPIIKPKSFLQTIEHVDWDALYPRLNRSDAEVLYRFFIRECHRWKRKDGKETKLYFIDRKDFSRDSIKMYRVYCRNSQYYVREFLDELEY